MRTGALNKLYSIDARGKLGYAGGFARITFGYNRFGFYEWLCGVYQKKYMWGRSYISKQRFYRSIDTKTDAQLAWRAVFVEGKQAYDALSSEEKQAWRDRTKRKTMTGYNLFMSEYLNSHKL
jgi:hypothetical protein